MSATPEAANAGAVALMFRLWSGFYDNPIPQRLFYRRIHHRILERWRAPRGQNS